MQRTLFLALCFFSLAISLRIVPTGLVSFSYVLLMSVAAIQAVSTLRSHNGATIWNMLEFPELVGILLFCYLLLSIAWSPTEAVFSAWETLSEYRIFVAIPILIFAFKQLDDEYINKVHLCFFLGLSAGLGFSILDEVELLCKPFYMRNLYIMNGFLSSVLIAYCFFPVGRIVRINSALRYLVAFLAACHVLILDEGRTGFIQIMVVLPFSVLMLRGSRRKLAVTLMSFSIFGAAFIFNPDFFSGLREIMINSDAYLESGVTLKQSEGQRLDFYFSALRIWLDNPVFGVGVGGLNAALELQYKAGLASDMTDNIHNEYLNQLAMGGFVGFAIFLAWLFGHLVRIIKLYRNADFQASGWYLVVGITLMVGMAFNSSLKDFGEKNLYTLVLVLAVWCYNRRVMRPPIASSRNQGL